MRRRTQKYILLLIGGLAVAGFIQSRRLHRQLTAAHDRIANLQIQYGETLRRLRRFQADIAVAESTAADEGRMAEEERNYYQRRMRRLEERIAFLETAAATVRASGAPENTTENMVDPRDPYGPPRDDLLAVLTDPELRDLLRVHMMATLEYEFEPLLTHYNYPAADEDTLLALLVEKKWNAMQLRLVTIQHGLEPELRAHAIAAIHDDQEDLRAVLHEFLGEEDFEVYETFAGTHPERMQVDRLQQQLARYDIPLDEEQQRWLIQIMHEEYTALEQFIETMIPDIGNGLRLDPELMDLYHDAAGYHFQRILENAETVLTEEQMTFFEDFTARQRAVQEAALLQAVGDGNRP